ncbi:MAG: hydroxyacid dehydrogenase [Flavobacteriales bacterium]|nr:hydroxyacid dehydrogenase [Flavobacteriales bacterium]|tara:strand:+ start:4579 stop:5550 length:972 start_codon:yes stop_codon:yes gene_type:complete
MNLGKVIFIDSVHTILWERLTKLGWICDDCTKSNPTEIFKKLNEYTGIVIRSRFQLNQEILSSLPNLKFIARAGSGLENIDTEYCHRKKIQVFSSPEGNRDSVAEHALGMLLMLQNNLKRADSEVRNGLWKRTENRGHELKEKTIGLIGYGVMAKAFAQRLNGFGVELIAFDKYKKNYSDTFTKEVSLETLLKKSDVISIHANYLPENKYIINASFIEQVEKPFILINTARGFNVNTADLVSGLKSGKIKGACLDVLEYESASFESFSTKKDNNALEYLKKSSNVILSPHIAGWTHESHFKLSNVLAEKIEKWITPEVLKNET